MAGRGRKAGFQMGAEHRSKIASSKIFNRLIKHAEGTEEMSPTQVTAAISLLDRVMPKMKPADYDGNQDNRVTMKVSIGGD